MTEYYNGAKVLSMKDLDGEEPWMYMVTSNRSAGKTTFFLKKFLTDFIESNGNKMFGLIYRHKYELSACASIFSDVLSMYFSDYEMHSKTIAGIFHAIYIKKIDSNEDLICGYAVSLNNTDVLKKYSSLFAKVEQWLFDEFQTESGVYLKNEIEKLQSVIFTVARGGGKQIRNIKLFMLSNKVAMNNPYFIYFQIYKRLKKDTRFLRGKGWVLECNKNDSAINAIKDNAISRTFAESSYMNYVTTSNYLHDSSSFIVKDTPNGKFKYLFTIKHDDVQLGVRLYLDAGILYISEKTDKTFKLVVTFQAENHTQNTIMLKNNSFLWQNVKDAMQGGYIRFDSLKTKDIIYLLVGIDMFN